MPLLGLVQAGPWFRSSMWISSVAGISKVLCTSVVASAARTPVRKLDIHRCGKLACSLIHGRSSDNRKRIWMVDTFSDAYHAVRGGKLQLQRLCQAFLFAFSFPLSSFRKRKA